MRLCPWVMALFSLFVRIQDCVAAAEPTDLYRCVSWGWQYAPNCGLENLLIADLCSGRFFVTYAGRAAWYPLRNVGDITIEVETHKSAVGDFPVYIEILPLPGAQPNPWCLDGYPGVVVARAFGSQRCGGVWESFGPINIQEIVPLGGLYALQLEFFSTVDVDASRHSPGIDCVRVVSHPSAIEPIHWGQAKALYR